MRSQPLRVITRAGLLLSVITALLLSLASVPASAAPEAESTPECEEPAGGEQFATADPAAVNLDPEKLREAVDFASSRLRLSVQVFREDCRVSTNNLLDVTKHIPLNIWSSTKSVIAMLAGIAVDRGEMKLDAPIGRYLPEGRHWGSERHRAITVRQLLTQTSGLRHSTVAEAFVPPAPHRSTAQQALAQPFVFEPGTEFQYSQRGVDLLASVIQHATSQDVIEYAQEHLFDPVGVTSGDYLWLRDLSGTAYGYAHLFIKPEAYARLGLLLKNMGSWRDERVLSESYINAMRTPTETNPCYGFLTWNNAGETCTSAELPAAETQDKRMVTSAPDDMFAMVGFLQQNNFVIPSLDMMVSWTGVGGEITSNLSGLLTANLAASELYHEFFRLLMSAVEDQDVADPGPYEAPENAMNFDLTNYLDAGMIPSGLLPATCEPTHCTASPESRGPLDLGGLMQSTVEGVQGVDLVPPANSRVAP